MSLTVCDVCCMAPQITSGCVWVEGGQGDTEEGQEGSALENACDKY